MSAFICNDSICNDSHITALAVYAARHRLGGHDDAQAIGDLLHAENVRSVNYRYGLATPPDFELCQWAAGQEFSRAQIVKAAECLEYQSCEHPGWEKSEAFRIVQAIIGRDRDRELPGYDDAQWQITPPEHTIQTLAEEMSAAFEQAERPNGETFRRLKADAPEWMTEVCRDAHDGGDMLPDDWRYQFIEQAVDALAGHEDADDARHSLEPDVYTSDLTGWLHSRCSRVEYLGEAMREYGTFKDGFQLLAAAQMMEKEEVFGQVLDALEAELGRRQRPEDQPEPTPVIADCPPEMRPVPSVDELLAHPTRFLSPDQLQTVVNHHDNDNGPKM